MLIKWENAKLLLKHKRLICRWVMRFKGQTLVVFNKWRAISHLGNYEGAKKCVMCLLQSDDPDVELLPNSEHQTARGGRCLCGLLSLPLMVGFVVARLSHLMLGRFLLHWQHVINNRAQVMDLNGPQLCMIDPSSQRNVFEVEVGASRCG